MHHLMLSSAAFHVLGLLRFLPVDASGFFKFAEAHLVCSWTLHARWPKL